MRIISAPSPICGRGSVARSTAVPSRWRCFAASFPRTENQDDIPLIEISPGTVTEVGAFSVEMVGLTHSIPDPTALAIRCDAGTVLHTGDWKFDAAPGLGNQTDTERLAQIGDEGVLAMVGDSTNAMVEGRTGSEADAEAASAM